MNKLLVILILIISWSPIHSQLLSSNKVDSLINVYAKKHSIVGLSIGVVDDYIIETKSFGQTSFDSQIQVTDSTLFNIASISKLFTATAIMQLVENGQLNLNDKLVDILPAFKMKDKRHLSITIQHLLSHSSGLMWDNKLKRSPDNSTSLPLYLDNLEIEKLNFKPGEKMSYETYSNVAFDLLGMVVEKTSSQKFPDYVSENILSKLGMSNSTFFYEDIDSSQLALPQIVAGDSEDFKKLNFQGIDRKRNPLLNGQPLALKTHNTIGEEYEHNPSGNLISSTKELNLWIKELLSIYNHDSENLILEKKSLAKMWEETNQIKGTNISIGLAWWIKKDEKLGASYFHVGTNPGYCSILMIYPEDNLGIVILCNGWYAKNGIWKQLFNDLSNLYLEN